MKRTNGRQESDARVFGEYFGWELTDNTFGVDVLARNGVWGKEPIPRDVDHRPHIDNAYYYRKNGRAVAIAAHLSEVPDRIDFFGRLWRIRPVVYADKNLSWHSPGRTTLVVYLAASPRQTGTATGRKSR